MGRLIVRRGTPLRGRVRVPGDKSISHRALLLGALAEGDSHIHGFLPCGDCLATLACLRALGVEVEMHDATTLTVHGCGLHGLRVPAAPLDCVRSGTTMRLLAGLLAGQPFDSVLTGDPQLLRRPMRRVVEPLRRMGAEIATSVGQAFQPADNGYAPLTVRGRQLHGCDHTLPVASAQVKSALLLAGLYADGPTIVRQPGPARDHTERMLKGQIGKSAGWEALTFDAETVALDPALIDHLRPLNIVVPGDISSAAYPLVAAALVPGSEVTIAGVGVNPTRTGLLDVLRAMGAEVVVDEQGCAAGFPACRNEPVADVTVRTSHLQGVEISGDTVVRTIDEFPVLAVAATQAHGTTVVREAAELRVKESDRIAALVAALRTLGAHIEPLPDGFIVEGPTPLHGGTVDSHSDHRLAMALAVAGLIADGEVVVEGAEYIADSFPGFADLMCNLGATIL